MNTFIVRLSSRLVWFRLSLLAAAFIPLTDLRAVTNYATPYTITTLAGLAGNFGVANGTGGAARFNLPSGVAVDGSGNVYVADTNSHTIRKITPSGVVTTFAGNAGSIGSLDGTVSAQFNQPYGVAVDGTGNVYVADTNNHTIRKITPSGVVSTFAGSALSPGNTDGPSGAARFRFPTGVAVDASSNVYVADSVNETIRMITPAGEVSTPAGFPLNPGSANGTGPSARFNHPTGVAVDSLGNLYVADSGNATIRKIAPDAAVTTLAGTAGSPGSTDGTGSAARFLNPFGLAVDGLGNVYVADSGNHTIRKITTAGVVTTLAGAPANTGSANGTGESARFNGPAGVAVDGLGKIYVADKINATIRKGALPSALGDFDGDGHSDIVFSNTITGDRAIWLMNMVADTPIGGGAYLPTQATSWVFSATGDFDDDGKSDILLSNTSTGDRAIWLMNGTSISAGVYLGVLPTSWSISGTGDFNGDAKSDILLTNTDTGDRAMWLMNGTSIQAGIYLPTQPTSWVFSGIGDFDGDGKSDILLTNTTTGDRAIWLMDGTSIKAGVYLGVQATVWEISGIGDFDADGKSDVLLTNTASGDRAMWLMNGTVIAAGAYLPTQPTNWVFSATGDYNGDASSDIFLTDTITGDRAVWLMDGTTVSAGIYVSTFSPDWLITK